MPIDPSQLRRGRICLAVFPFAPAFPLTLEDGTALQSVEDWARSFKGSPGRVVSEARLRPIVPLHDRTRTGHGDVVCLRINTVKAAHRADPTTWKKIEQQEHPFFFHLPAATGRYQLREDSVIAITSIAAVHRSAILAATGGELARHELEQIGEKLVRALDVDLAPWVAAKARELLAKAGIELPPQS